MTRRLPDYRTLLERRRRDDALSPEDYMAAVRAAQRRIEWYQPGPARGVKPNVSGRRHGW